MIKALWMWKTPDLDQLIQAMERIRAHICLIKVSDASNIYNNPSGPTVSKLHRHSFETWGWSYCYGSNPEGEAMRIAERIESLGLGTIVLDIESEFTRHDNVDDRAHRLMEALHFNTTAKIGVSTFDLPSLHPSVPYEALMPYVDFWVPQTYWHNRDPVQRTNQCLKEYLAFYRPVYPAASLSRPEHKEDDLTRWYDLCKNEGVPLISFWAHHLLDESWQQHLADLP